MSDLFLLYTIITYLFMFGVVVRVWGDLDRTEIIGAIISLIFAPILTPFLLGHIHASEHS